MSEILLKNVLHDELQETLHYDQESIYESKQILVPKGPVKCQPPEEKDDNKHALFRLTSYTRLYGIMYAVVMEDTIMKIRLLHGCNNELLISKLMSDMEHLLKTKFGVQLPAITDELEGIDHKNLGCHQYKLDKLFADRKHIEDVFGQCYIDLSQKIVFDTLNKQINEIEKRDSHDAFLIEDVANNKIMSRDLFKQRRTQHNHIKSVIYDTDVAIDLLKNQVEDALLIAETQSRYVDNWQKARNEQHIQDLSEKENIPNSSIQYYGHRGEQEIRVHGEVESLTNLLINETLDKIEKWMNKFDEDMENMDLKIRIKKNDYQNMRDNRIMLEQTYAKHDQLMKDWIKFKEDREKARIYIETMTNSAITVQAWWRGLLVRLMLGPYKVSKKQKKK